MGMNWTNLYGDTDGLWLRGNLHTHSGEGMIQEELLGRYAELGYDFVSITDHMHVTIPRPPAGNTLLTLPGVEWNSKTGEHMTLISPNADLLESCLAIENQQAVLTNLKGRQVLRVLNHPNWRIPPHYSRDDLMDRPAVDGIEIYNAKGEAAPGEAMATEKWDYLLSRGRKILGFAGDDAHHTQAAGAGWIMACTADRTVCSLFDALRKGRFYCSSGVRIDTIRRSGSVIEIEAADAEEIWAVGEWGARLQRIAGPCMRLDFEALNSPYRKYVRFVAFGRGSVRAWTQPFFEKSPEDNRRTSPFVENWKVSGRLLSIPLADVRPPSPSDPRPDRQDVKAQVFPEGFVNIGPIHGKRDGICLLAVRVEVVESGSWTIGLGHDGGARLFVDGVPVIDAPHPVNPSVPDRSRAEIQLERGEHEIVVALETRAGLGQGIFLRFMIPKSIEPAAGRPVFPRPVDDDGK